MAKKIIYSKVDPNTGLRFHEIDGEIVFGMHYTESLAIARKRKQDRAKKEKNAEYPVYTMRQLERFKSEDIQLEANVLDKACLMGVRSYI